MVANQSLCTPTFVKIQGESEHQALTTISFLNVATSLVDLKRINHFISNYKRDM